MSARTAADVLSPAVSKLLGPAPPVGVRFWDGSSLGPEAAPATLVVRSPKALRRVLYAPSEVGLARAYVSGDLDLEGDLYAALSVRERLGPNDANASPRVRPSDWLEVLRAAPRLGLIGPPPRPPAEEVRLRGRRHSKERDAAAIAHHYDLPAEFYRLFLGETMTYSCAYFETPDTDLDQAQTAKYELICRKLDLRPGMRLLDVGCGFGGMVIHAARHHGVRATGITVSARQVETARKRAAEAGLEELVEIHPLDYRDVDDGPYDAISSIGMYEHVGQARLEDYFSRLHGLLRPQGRLLNHGITHPPSVKGFTHDSFLDRYVFPDGELHEVGAVASAAQRCHFEVRDVESLREHYARTLRHWVANLERHWQEAVGLVGEGRARVWRLYMAGACLSFEAGRTNVHQVLAVRADDGRSGLPATRLELLGMGTASGPVAEWPAPGGAPLEEASTKGEGHEGG
jgi:cyclopropane-fatty-acyl-phospholipid synthase